MIYLYITSLAVGPWLYIRVLWSAVRICGLFHMLICLARSALLISPPMCSLKRM